MTNTIVVSMLIVAVVCLAGWCKILSDQIKFLRDIDIKFLERREKDNYNSIMDLRKYAIAVDTKLQKHIERHKLSEVGGQRKGKRNG